MELPKEVLVIHYHALSPDPLTRLEVVTAIGQLLEASGQAVSLSSLDLSPSSARALHAWLNSDEASRFWRVEGHAIVIRSPCEKHILVGTRCLLRDLRVLARKLSSPRLADLDRVWQAATRLVEQGISR